MLLNQNYISGKYFFFPLVHIDCAKHKVLRSFLLSKAFHHDKKFLVLNIGMHIKRKLVQFVEKPVSFFKT